MQNEFTAVLHPYSSIQHHRNDFPPGSDNYHITKAGRRAPHGTRLQWLSIVKSSLQFHLPCEAIRIASFDSCFEAAYPSFILQVPSIVCPFPSLLACAVSDLVRTHESLIDSEVLRVCQLYLLILLLATEIHPLPFFKLLDAVISESQETFHFFQGHLLI